MKKDRIIYWITTSLIALSGLTAGVVYLTSHTIAEEFKHLGFPVYFRVELAIAKLLGSFVIILPMVSARIKEWAYTGFAIAFISAIIAHSATEGVSAAISPLLSLLLLIMSYVYYAKLCRFKALA